MKLLRENKKKIKKKRGIVGENRACCQKTIQETVKGKVKVKAYHVETRTRE